MSLKILLVTPVFPPAVSGVGDYVRRLALEMTTRGHQVTVLTSTLEKPPQASESFRVLRSVRSWGLLGLFSFNRLLKSVSADVTNLQYAPHAYGWRGINLGLPLALWGLKLVSGLRLVITCHELHERWSWKPQQFFLAVVHRVQLIIVVAASERIIVITEGQREDLQPFLKLFARPVEVIPLGSTIEPRAATNGSLDALRRQLAPQGERLIGNFSLMLDASLYEKQRKVGEALRARGLPVRLILLGSQKSRQPLPELPEWIYRTGYLPEDLLSSHLACMDLLFCFRPEGPTTRHTSVMAALAHGVPILALRTDQVGQEAFCRSAGIEVAADQTDDLIRQAERLLSHEDERAKRSAQARAYYQSHLDWARIAEKIEAYYPRSPQA